MRITLVLLFATIASGCTAQVAGLRRKDGCPRAIVGLHNRVEYATATTRPRNDWCELVANAR